MRRGRTLTRILLVEEDERDASQIREALATHKDWEIVQVGTVLEAIRTAGETPFDAAVLDYELPDGTGLDLLDFLRIGSPGIRIVLLSKNGSESLAFQALSHGAGDYLVKDRRLPSELPRRMDALLQHVDATAAFVETLRPSEGSYDVHDDEAPSTPGAAPPPQDRSKEIQAVLEASLQGSVFAGAVYNARGRPLAVHLVPPLDGDALGFSLGMIHAQIGAIGATTELRPLSYATLVQVEGGLLGLTAVPGPYLVALLMAQSTPHDKGLRLLVETARKVADVMKA